MTDLKIGDEVYIHGFVDEVRRDTVIIKNEGGYFGTVTEEIIPSKQTEQKWIPCNERLPKYGKNVLITNDKGNVSYGKFRGVEFWREDGDAHWRWKHNTIEHVLAWMPLPKPWRGEANEGTVHQYGADPEGQTEILRRACRHT